MNTITRRDLARLAEVRGEHLISLYMPTYTGAEHRQNPQRYKNLLRTAEEKLAKRDGESHQVKKLLGPARALLDEPRLWVEQGPSLAVFVAPDDVVTWRLPVPCGELCAVGSCFHLIPMITWLNNDAPYYVL